jgi:hypothetical protein
MDSGQVVIAVKVANRMVQIGQNWTCPYCELPQVIAEERIEQKWYNQHVDGWARPQSRPSVLIRTIIRANNACKELTLEVALGAYVPGPRDREISPIRGWQLLPLSSAKPQPDYIPKPIRDDYEEACAIRKLSPKASATMTWRCLQGMIRDFCGISKKRLIDEISDLRKRVREGNAPAGVQSDSVEAIDHVRGIGNIGAHMEADINVIVDVDPDEAQILIDLVETLFEEWYVAREVRQKRFNKIKEIADDKKAAKKAPPPASSSAA